MQSDIHHSDDNDATEASQLATSLSAPNRLARRSFLRNLGLGAALLVPGAALLRGSGKALADNANNALTRGDVAILQLLAAAELIETDLWQQYNELGGINAPTSGYTAALQILDGDQLLRLRRCYVAHWLPAGCRNAHDRRAHKHEKHV